VENLNCSRCGGDRDTQDNFCRACGHQFTVNLPAVRESRLPARTNRAIPPSLVGSVAVLAVGTGIEWLARRMAGLAARAAGRALIGGERPLPPARRNSESQSVTVDEVIYVRKVEVRR
jgi:hypothetical protein